MPCEFVKHRFVEKIEREAIHPQQPHRPSAEQRESQLGGEAKGQDDQRAQSTPGHVEVVEVLFGVVAEVRIEVGLRLSDGQDEQDQEDQGDQLSSDHNPSVDTSVDEFAPKHRRGHAEHKNMQLRGEEDAWGPGRREVTDARHDTGSNNHGRPIWTAIGGKEPD